MTIRAVVFDLGGVLENEIDNGLDAKWEEKTARPELRIFEITCERLQVAPAEILFLDNIPEIVKSARAFGIRAILFENNAQAIAAVKEALAM
jgi:FMN phosphatase YigB (HAD superfamily)